MIASCAISTEKPTEIISPRSAASPTAAYLSNGRRLDEPVVPSNYRFYIRKRDDRVRYAEKRLNKRAPLYLHNNISALAMSI